MLRRCYPLWSGGTYLRRFGEYKETSTFDYLESPREIVDNYRHRLVFGSDGQ